MNKSNQKVKYGSISIDLDPVDHYFSARNLEPTNQTKLNAVYEYAIPRMLDIFDMYNIKVTFFCVGKDVKNKKNWRIVKKMVESGHEIANHTYSHFQNFPNLDRKIKQEEIEKADKILTDVTGKKIIGFRAPGWGLDATIIQLLEDMGYQYDASVFPCKILSLVSTVNWLLNRKKLKTHIHKCMGISPKRPYFPSKEAFWKPGNAGILEIPMTVLPFIQIPFLGTLLFLWGKSIFNLQFNYLKLFDQPLIYILHGLELVDYYQEINDDRLLVKPGLGKSIDEKYQYYQYIFQKFLSHYPMVMMKDLVERMKK